MLTPRTLAVLTASALLAVTELAAEPPAKPPEQKDDEAVAALIEAAKTAELRAIGIGGPASQSFTRDDVKDWPKFNALLRKREGPASRIWELLPKDVRDATTDDAVTDHLAARDPEPPATRGLMTDTAHEIKKMLARPDFYTEKMLEGVKLDKRLRDALARGDKRTHLETLRMNRELLCSIFPECITPVPENYHRVPVAVKAGKPVVLVLTSYTACTWQVTVEEGGEVAGVILGGTGPQEVVGVKAPVLYRAGRGPDGKPRKGDVLWTSFNRDDKSFAELEGGVKRITGATLNEFHGVNTAPAEGFVVRPSPK